MHRIAVNDPDTGAVTGTWFDRDRATKYEEDRDYDGSRWISRATGSQWNHEVLFRTASGRWILNEWSQYGNRLEKYYEVSEATAHAWLLANDHADAVPAEEVEAHEVGAGKTPQRTIRIADDLWFAAQERARAEDTDASGLIRRLLSAYLAQEVH